MAAPLQTATPLGGGPMGPRPPTPVSPAPSKNEADAIGRVSADSLARDILKSHKAGLNSRRERDLISEKLLLHVDGSGDFQWADIFDGIRVEIPRAVSEFRKTENILRLLVDNAVAHHTTMALRFMAESMPDRRAKNQAIVDTIWANHLSHTQDFNGLFAEALYLAMPAGFCPVHAYWREDTSYDWYETAGYGQGGTPAPGMIDCFVGNPFATVFDVSARKNSVRWSSYERLLPADLVREQFGHMPGVSEIEGTTKIPSTAEFQIIAKQWMMATSGVHGSPVLHARRDSAEEILTVICREIAPGVGGHVGGRLQIIAVPGNADSRRGEGGGGHAVILADQELPGRDFSWTNIYSHHRGSDIYGKPWVEDLDPLQVDLNIARSKRWETVLKMAEAPIVAPGGAISEDMADLGGYNLLEVEPSLANWRPRVMEWSQGLLPALDKEVEELRRALYTGGGYQASSRGEAPGSRMAYRAIVALQQADNTIHGPVNVQFQRSACDFMGRCHSQFRMYGDVPWLVNIVGDEFAHLAKRHIDKTQVSDRRPQFRLVNSFGPSPELRAQEILELMSLRGADGQPFMTTEEARRQYPNPLVFDTNGDPTAVKRRRAMTIAEEIHNLADQYRQQTGMADELGRRHPWTMEAGDQVFQQIEQVFPRLRDDLLEAHIAALSEITQDETADPIACVAAEMRLELYFQWQAMMAGIPTAGSGAQPGGTGAPARDGMDPASVATEMQGGGGQGGTTLDDAEGGGQPAVAATAR